MILSPEQSLNKLKNGNLTFIKAIANPADISIRVRHDTASGQHPHAVLMTCADSRVPPEHIFSAGIGELFVIRTGGNVVGNFELGSIEFAVAQLNAPLIVVMGHTECGAIQAAMKGEADGHIGDILREIKLGLNDAPDEDIAIKNNVQHCMKRIMASEILGGFLDTGKVMLIGAIYDIATGVVHFFASNTIPHHNT
jgi:carbonic anhydrase